MNTTENNQAPARPFPLALSIRQPWAWLIVQGLKDIENRDWPTQYRGRFQVHAGKIMTRADYEACQIFVAGFSDLQLPPMKDLPRGGIVGEAELVDCVSRHPSNWFCGEWGFVLVNGKATPFVECPGALGFFDPVKVKQELRERAAAGRKVGAKY